MGRAMVWGTLWTADRTVVGTIVGDKDAIKRVLIEMEERREKVSGVVFGR